MNIFVISSTYIVDNLIKITDYIYRERIERINILRENSVYMLNKNIDSRVVEYNNIQECSENSDYIIAIVEAGSYRMPASTIETLEKISKTMHKALLKINLNKSCAEGKRRFAGHEIKPVILTLGVGEASNYLFIEFLINKILSENNVIFLQNFSRYAQNLIEQLDEVNLLNSSMCQHISQKSNQGILVDSLIIDKTAELETKEHILKELHPDYCVVCTSYGFDGKDELEQYFWYKYRCKANVVESEYINVYDSARNLTSIKINRIEMDQHGLIEKQLFYNIISALALPNGVKRIKT